ncbi:MAG: hypothetical protein ACHQX1_00300 [Candidatus Micrarchaeales archaeon]
MLGTIVITLIAFLSIMVPGFLLALALLRKTELNLFEIGVFGFIFGFIGPATLTWLESYLISFSSFFSFSFELYELNTLLLTIIGLALCYQQGAFKSFKEEFFSKGNEHEASHRPAHHKKNPHWWVWAFLLALMLSTFGTRMLSIGTAPTFFEFDPYFDMVDTQYILTYGQQLLLDPSAWPSVPMGTNHRIEPLIPYIEAYWYDLSNSLGTSNYTQLDTTLLSLTAGIYPPIAAALLVFVIFVLLYHEYDEYIALIGASLTATMPVIITTFIAGEQLVEPWGIFALFFFLAAYMLATKNMKSTRLAILTGIAFVSNFLGAHYYTVTTGVLVIYILLQGVIDVIRGHSNKDFYRMNAIIIAVITIFYILYFPYSSTLQNRVPSVLGIPIVLSGPIIALALVAFMEYVPKLLMQRNMVFKSFNIKERLIWVGIVAIIGVLLILFTPLGKPIQGYLTLSTKFTTPSSPLFMTVEEFIPTGLFYNFGAQGFGVIGANVFGVPLIIWIVTALAILLLSLSVLFRDSRTGVLYMAMSLPLTFAGFSEVKYLPHFGVAYILMFCVILGELIYYTERNFKIGFASKQQIETENTGGLLADDTQGKNQHIIKIILAIGIFFVSTIIGILYLLYTMLTQKFSNKDAQIYIGAVLALFVIIIIAMYVINQTMNYGESSTYVDAISSATTAAGNPPNLCTILNNKGASIGYTLFCNNIQPYWLNAMAWIKANVGPNGPRVLSWWDYGDWINWFGNGNAFLRGDNANATEDYATAAHFVFQRYNSTALANFMNTNQTKYVLFDQDLISKWQALDFLSCIYVNQTSQAFAKAQGAAQNPPVPYLLGTSSCEQTHDPQFALIPLATLIQTNQSPNINFYCSISNASTQYVQSYLLTGNNFSNQTACVNINPNSRGVLKVYSQAGNQINAYIQSSNYLGIINVQGTPFVEYLMIYVPNIQSANGLIVSPPSKFYNSNYYRAFVLGDLPGFTQVYPSNAVGVNFINGTWPIRIFALNNFTGKLPLVPPKPSYVQNNYTMP